MINAGLKLSIDTGMVIQKHFIYLFNEELLIIIDNQEVMGLHLINKNMSFYRKRSTCRLYFEVPSLSCSQLTSFFKDRCFMAK